MSAPSTDDGSEHTHLCLHWCYTYLKTVLGSSAHQSEGLYHHVMIWDAQDIHHRLIVSISISSKCHCIKHYQSQGLFAYDELG